MLTMEPMLVDQNVVLTRTSFLTGRSRSFQRIALRMYVGRMINAAAASHNGEAEPIAAPILSIPVHPIKTIRRMMPTARDALILIILFLLGPKSITLSLGYDDVRLLKGIQLLDLFWLLKTTWKTSIRFKKGLS